MGVYKFQSFINSLSRSSSAGSISKSDAADGYVAHVVSLSVTARNISIPETSYLGKD